MSGIFGLVRLDGRPATADSLEPIGDALAHRGPDGRGTWAHGPVALGFSLLATTPEAVGETLPLTHAPSGCTITADVRLDNRDELASDLGIDPRGKGDGELILLAYLRWGEAVTDHLLGDFAFAIWDQRHRRLLAVRDPIGMRQLHYCFEGGRIFAFATDDHAMLAHPEIPARLAEVRVADFLANLEGVDLTSTFYRDVQRLPPAHLLTVNEGALRIRRYWQLEPGEPLRLSSAGDYADAFLDVFTQAVRARMRSARPVGAMLSGGLDSSSVVAVAAGLRGDPPLPVFSAVDADAGDCTETRMIRRVQALCGLEPHEVRLGDLHALAADLLPALGRYNPFDGHMALVASVYQLAQRTGCNVVLDGVAGDIVLDHRNWIARLLRQGDLRQVWAEAKGEHRFWGDKTPLRILADAARAAFISDGMRAIKRETACLAGRVLPRAGIMRRDFARSADLAGRMRRLARTAPSPAQPYQSDRVAAITHNHLVVGRERYDRVASLFGIEARDPFLDLRLVRFALALPPEQLVRNGFTKRILREAMAGRLPDEVRWRRGKEHLGTKFIVRSISAQQPAWNATIGEQLPALRNWIRPDVLRRSLSGSATPDDQDAHSVGYLAQWLAAGTVDSSAAMRDETALKQDVALGRKERGS